MRFLSNLGCKIIFLWSVNFWHQLDSHSLFKGSIGHVRVGMAYPQEVGFWNTFHISSAKQTSSVEKKFFFGQIIKTKSASFECIHCSFFFPFPRSFVGVIFELIGRKKTYLSALFHLGSFSKTGLESVKRRHEVGVYCTFFLSCLQWLII